MPLELPTPDVIAAGGIRLGNRVLLLRGPSLARKAVNLARAVAEAAKAGRPIFASDEVQTARRAACFLCDYWKPSGNLGFGECRHPGCGCTRVKLKLASARCPAGKWPS